MAGGVWGGHGSCGAGGRVPRRLRGQRAQDVSSFFSVWRLRLISTALDQLTSVSVRHKLHVSRLFVGNLQRKPWRTLTKRTPMDRLTKPLRTLTMSKLVYESTEEGRCRQSEPLITHQHSAKCLHMFCILVCQVI